MNSQVNSTINHGFYHHIDNENRVIVTTCISEKATEEDMLNALACYQDTIQNHADIIDYNEVLIFPEATDITLTMNGVKKLAKLAVKSDGEDPNRKLAILMQTNLGYGLAKIYQAYRTVIKRSGKKVRVYKQVKSALAWAKKTD